MTTAEGTPHRGQLGVWDGVSVIIGIVVGVSLYKAPALIFGAAGSATTSTRSASGFLGRPLSGALVHILCLLCRAAPHGDERGCQCERCCL